MLSTYDLVVYNMGDHLEFHREVFLAAQRVPGVVILHDFVMHHFFAGYYLHDLQDQQAYIAAMHRLYGPKGRRIAQDAAAGKRSWVWDTDELMEYPFFEPAVRGAYGVVTHSEFFLEHVEKVYPGPVKRISLAYDAELAGPAYSRKELGVPKGNVLAVTVGHLNPNKQIHAVIETLGRGPELARNLTYALMGPCEGEYRDRLMAAIRRHGLENAVLLLGYTPDDRMTSFLAYADFCINLRYSCHGGRICVARRRNAARQAGSGYEHRMLPRAAG